MQIVNIFNKILYSRKIRQEQANRKRRLLDRIRYDIALLHQEAASHPLAAKEQ